MPKSTQTRKWWWIYKAFLHLFTKEQRCRKGLCIFTITFILPCLCTFWHAIPTSLFIFLSCFCTFLVMFSVMLWSKHYFNHNPISWNSTDNGVIVQVSPNMQPHTGSRQGYVVSYMLVFARASLVLSQNAVTCGLGMRLPVHMRTNLKMVSYATDSSYTVL